MMREKYESLSLGVLKDLAKARDIKGTSTMKKAELVEAMLKKDEEEAVASSTTPARTKSSEKTVKSKNSAADEKGSVKDKKVSAKGEEAEEKSAEKVTEEKKPDDNGIEEFSKDKESLDSGVQARGILEVMSDGYGFIRCANYLPGENDVYVAPSQIRRFGLKTGDIICGNTRIKGQNDKFAALLYVKSINGYTPSDAAKRRNFEEIGRAHV